MKEELIEIVNEWDKEGYLVKKVANNVPIFIPKHLAPQVQIIDLDTEWVTQKIYMTKKQFTKEYGSMLAHLHEEGLLKAKESIYGTSNQKSDRGRVEPN